MSYQSKIDELQKLLDCLDMHTSQGSIGVYVSTTRTGTATAFVTPTGSTESNTNFHIFSITIAGALGELTWTAKDEFELQDWFINHYNK